MNHFWIGFMAGYIIGMFAVVGVALLFMGAKEQEASDGR